jgi:hypothetical protein
MRHADRYLRWYARRWRRTRRPELLELLQAMEAAVATKRNVRCTVLRHSGIRPTA